MSFPLPGWALCLAKVDSRENQFRFVAEATPDHVPIATSDVEQLTRRLRTVLGLVAGRDVGLMPVGVDDTGDVVWSRWGAPRFSPEKAVPSWCPRHLVRNALPALAAGITELTADPSLETVVERSVQHLLAANERIALDVRIPVICSGLEMLAWAVLQRREWLTPDTLGKRPKIPVSARVRLLLQWAQIPVGIPSRMAALTRRRNSLGHPTWAGPEVTFNVRNRLVHPPDRLDSPQWPTHDELIEAWELSTWHLELCILRTLGYRGEYRSRLQRTGWAGTTEPVPWCSV